MLSPRSTARFGLLAVAVVLLTGLSVLLLSGMRRSGWTAEAGKQAVDFTLLTHEGMPLSLNSLHGQSVALLVMPAEAEMDPATRLAIEELHRRAIESGLIVVAVTSEPMGIDVTKDLISLIDRSGDVAGKYMVMSAPTVFVIDSAGTIQRREPLQQALARGGLAS